MERLQVGESKIYDDYERVGDFNESENLMSPYAEIYLRMCLMVYLSFHYKCHVYPQPLYIFSAHALEAALKRGDPPHMCLPTPHD